MRVIEGQYVFDALEDFDTCQNRNYYSDACIEGLDQWLAKHPEDFFKAAKRVRFYFTARAAIPYFSKSKDRPLNFCSDHDLNLAVLSALQLPSDDLTILPQAKKIALNNCFTEMKSSIRAEFTTTNVFENSCKAFLELGLLKSLQRKKCQNL